MIPFSFFPNTSPSMDNHLSIGDTMVSFMYLVTFLLGKGSCSYSKSLSTYTTLSFSWEKVTRSRFLGTRGSTSLSSLFLKLCSTYQLKGIVPSNGNKCHNNKSHYYKSWFFKRFNLTNLLFLTNEHVHFD